MRVVSCAFFPLLFAIFVFCVLNYTPVFALYIEAGTLNGQFVGCKGRSIDELTPGTARNRKGKAFKSIKSQVTKVKTNSRLTSKNRKSKIRSLNKLSSKILKRCRIAGSSGAVPALTPTSGPNSPMPTLIPNDPTPTYSPSPSPSPTSTPIRTPAVVGNWLLIFGCDEALGAGCEESIELTFRGDMTYDMAARGGATCLYSRYSYGQYHFYSEPYPFSIMSSGTYTYENDGTLTFYQSYSRSAYRDCRLTGLDSYDTINESSALSVISESVVLDSLRAELTYGGALKYSWPFEQEGQLWFSANSSNLPLVFLKQDGGFNK